MTDEKSRLRASMREHLRSLSNESCHSKSRQICHYLEHSAYLKTADPLLTYAALPGEPDLLPLFGTLSSQQTFCFPRVIGSQLEIRRVSDASELILGYENILEPSPENCPLFPEKNLRVILLPGLAFDPITGGRLGKGKGFYDRLIQNLTTTPKSSLVKIGVCFNCQLSSVPEETHDQRVDAIVTEQGFLTPQS